MSSVKHVLAGLGGDVTPDCYSPVAVLLVFGVVAVVLALGAGVAYALVFAVVRVRRRREQRAVSRLIGRVDGPGPAPARHRRPVTAWGGGRRV